ncbi:unnamed protein product, partial [Nesidiocoris tenuis]
MSPEVRSEVAQRMKPRPSRPNPITPSGSWFQLDKRQPPSLHYRLVSSTISTPETRVVFELMPFFR